VRFWLFAACAVVFLPSPASATRFQLFAAGTLLQSPAPNQTLTGLPFGQGSHIFGSWTVDIAAGTAADQTPPGSPTTGQARLINGAVSNGYIQIQSTGGDISLVQSSNSLGALYALNDVAGSPGRRLDQLTLTDGARATPGGLVLGYENSLGARLPPGVFLGAVSFGRVASDAVATPPTLLTSLDGLDPYTLWQTGPWTFGLNFRSGTATTQALISPCRCAVFPSASPMSH
jgi:hypothetical protein